MYVYFGRDTDRNRCLVWKCNIWLIPNHCMGGEGGGGGVISLSTNCVIYSSFFTLQSLTKVTAAKGLFLENDYVSEHGGEKLLSSHGVCGCLKGGYQYVRVCCFGVVWL